MFTLYFTLFQYHAEPMKITHNILRKIKNVKKKKEKEKKEEKKKNVKTYNVSTVAGANA